MELQTSRHLPQLEESLCLPSETRPWAGSTTSTVATSSVLKSARSLASFLVYLRGHRFSQDGRDGYSGRVRDAGSAKPRHCY